MPDCANYRSAVPDLLFEDVLDARLADIQPYLHEPERIDHATPLHRLTVFLTYRCNLSCPYCKTIARTAAELGAFPQKAETFDLASFRSMLDAHDGTPIQHLHFTGGEATLVADLPDMVALARARGIVNVSITSNGTRAPAVFAALVERGVTEIRLSVDTQDAALGQILSGRPRAWASTIRTLASLVELRRDGRPFFLIANMVVAALNRREIARVVRFLLDSGVDDIKLITAVDERGTLGTFSGAAPALRDIAAMLAAYPDDAFPLLRRKVGTVFSPAAIGLDDVVASPRHEWRCYIPLTERTIDAVYYYPCSVYLREGGRPLGRIDEAPDRQREKTVRFVRDGQCLDDTICRRYCLHCTKAYNVAANEARVIAAG